MSDDATPINHPFPRVGVGALILNNVEVLLQLRLRSPERNLWGIPGGKVEWGECVEVAVVREVLEETSLKVTAHTLLCVSNHILPEEDMHWVSPIFLAKIVEGEAKNLEPEKIADLRWFPLDDLPQNLTITASDAITAFNRC